MAKYLLAVDGGGTKTDAICADENGNIIGSGSSGPTNLTTTSVGASSFNLIEAIRQATQNLPADEEKLFPVLVMGLAGLDSQTEKEAAYEIFTQSLSVYNIGNFILVNDSLIALENGSSNANSLILISGTGSICFGKNQDGLTAKTSGMDFLLADQGSGYAIGRRVLREAVKSYDGRTKKSLLETLVCEHFRIPSILELKNEVYNPLLSKIEIADLAHLFTLAYEKGDEAAKDIYEKTVNEIIEMISTVVEKLQLNNDLFDCVFSGAIMKLSFMQEKVTLLLKDKYQNINIIFPETEPVLGALKIAMKNFQK